MFKENLENKLKAIYKEVTMANLKTAVRALYRHLQIELKEYDKSIILDNIDKVIEYIKTQKAQTGKVYLNYYCKLLSLEDSSNEQLCKLFTEVANVADKQRHENKNNKLVDIDVESIYKYFIDALDEKVEYIDRRGGKEVKRFKKAPITQTKAFRVCLFSILSVKPVRLTELTNMIYEDDGINNYIDFANQQMIIRKHKNAKGVRNIKLPDRTIKDIKFVKDNFESKYLFSKKRVDDDVSIEPAGLEQMMRVAMKEYNTAHNIEHVKGKQGIHSIRHNKVTKEYEKLNVKLEEVKQILSMCKDLGHTIGTGLKDYFKDTD